MMLSTILFAAASLAVTNAPSAFSTMVERTVPCPVVTEPKVGMKFDLDLPQSLDCRVEVTVGHDSNGDGSLLDEESKIALSWSNNSVVVLGRNGEIKASAGYVPNGKLLAFVINPGKGTMPSFWQLAESGSAPFCVGSFEPEIRVPDFNLARVRVTGPSASSLVVTPKRVHGVHGSRASDRALARGEGRSTVCLGVCAGTGVRMCRRYDDDQFPFFI